ncbi:MAG: hypothetical protein RLZ44_1624, partial [Pseudomonadota bacterium]
ELFRKESLFVTMLKSTGRDYAASPVLQALRRVGVASVMEDKFVRSGQVLTAEQAAKLLAGKPAWILVDVDGSPKALLPALDLVKHLESAAVEEQGEAIDLLEIPAQRLQVAPVHLQETLQQALDRLQHTGVEALYVQRMTAPGITRIYGVLTRAMLESTYRY